jgi:hypothetical protein
MRNRDLIVNKIENIEGFLKTLRRIVLRNEPIEAYLNFLEKSEITLDEVKSMIEREDLSPNELNKI